MDEQDLIPKPQSVVARIEQQLALLQESLIPPPFDAPPIDSGALSAHGTAKIEAVLDKVLELQERAYDVKKKYKDAVKRLLKADSKELPVEAKAQLHVLVGSGYFRLGDYGKSEEHFRKSAEFGRASGSKAAIARALGNLGCVHKTSWIWRRRPSTWS